MRHQNLFPPEPTFVADQSGLLSNEGESKQRRIQLEELDQNRTSLTAHAWSSSSLLFFPRGKLQLDPFHPFTSKH